MPDEIIGQQRDVVSAFPEGRDGERDDVEPVIQVFAERVLSDDLFERHFGGGDDPYIHSDGPGPADAPELPAFQETQQLDLHIDGYVVDIVEENAPRMGQLEQSFFAFPGACISSFLMAEELAGQQVGGNGRETDLDQGMGAAVAGPVDVLGQDLFSHAGLADEQNG